MYDIDEEGNSVVVDCETIKDDSHRYVQCMADLKMTEDCNNEEGDFAPVGEGEEEQEAEEEYEYDELCDYRVRDSEGRPLDCDTLEDGDEKDVCLGQLM